MADTSTPSETSGTERMEPYRVLARKYRPQSFPDLIGQEAMVKTLSNAFSSQRIHQAYIFTGVRGVGKTTTARILARALNYKSDTVDAPSIDMPTLGEHCQAIMESRHVDVIEMDAASNTSINNIREIIEAARYKPVSARTKVYIIDEVHMLSNAAFNGLLKTLEEPPPHVKFLFATTEIRKVPVTVLSRCQRFDLRRIEIPAMVAYLETILAKEGVQAEAEALQLIARASEGSMRDALSLLDQAISHGAGQVKAADVRDSLGLADRTRVIDLFGAVMSGEIAAALQDFDRQHFEGADPLAILTDLGEFIHVVTRLKLVPDAAKDAGLSQTERERGLDYAKKVPIRALTMAWQIVLKGLAEVQGASRPKIAAEMVLVRLAYAADLPGPGEIIRELKSGAYSAPAISAPSAPGGAGPQASGNTALAPRVVADQGAAFAPQRAPQASSLPQPQNFAQLVALADAKRDITLKTALERDVRVVSFEVGRIEIALLERAEADLPNRLYRALKDWTGASWGVSVARNPAPQALSPTLHEEAEARRDEEARGIAAHPAVRAVLERFPGAQIVGIREPEIADLPGADTAEPEDPEFTDEDL